MNWYTEARQILRAEMVRKNVTVEQLAKALSTMGIDELPSSLAVKISRGKFQLSFFLQCLVALKIETVTIHVSSIKPFDDGTFS
jgi:hypothetical protein